MCGIAGILRTWRPGEDPPEHLDAIPEPWLDILDESVKHRGPDGQGRFRQRVTRTDGTVVDMALVHRRLSIIDPADGAQPMVIGAAAPDAPAWLAPEDKPYAPVGARGCPTCGDSLLAVAFNGCIYNHRQLREELARAGHRFHTDHSDTEVLLHGWREWGVGIRERLEGMYAALWWDAATGTVALGRDGFGEKPLYYGTVGEDGPILFASGPLGLAIAAREDGVAPIDDQRLVEWVRLGYDAEAGPFKDIGQLGHGVVIDGGRKGGDGYRLKRDQDHAAQPGRAARLKRAMPTVGGQTRLLDRLDSVLGEAVAARLEADVPLGCLLSGGVDSSLISHYAAGRTEHQLTTLCVRMPDERYDESGYAEIAAQHLGTRHITVDADPSPAEDLLLLIHTLGLPFGDSSLLPTYWACRAAADEVKVLLSGDGGDELFLGYERYLSCKYVELVGMFGFLRPIAGALARTAPRRDPKSRHDKLARFLHAASAGPEQAYREMLAIFQRRDAGLLFDLPRKRPNLIDAWVNDAMDARDYDLHNHLPGDMLRKVDTASMLAGIEVRAPFLDSTVAKLAMSLPEHRLLPRGKRKGLLRALARRHLPTEIVDRPKMGFAIPIGEWFRTDYGGMRQLLHDHLGSAEPFPGLPEAGVELNPAAIEAMLREHDAAGEHSPNPWRGRDHSQRLYVLLVLSIWCRWLRGA